MPTLNKKLVERVERRFKERFGKLPDHISRAPGRVNLLGEHVDYNDGFVMPAAIDRATYVAFSISEDTTTRIIADDLKEEVSFMELSSHSKKQLDGSLLPDWGLYPAGVMQTLIDKGYSASPMSAVFASDVPRGAGLSSSASLEMSFLIAWQGLNEWSLPLIERAKICLQAEVEYVGVNCGIMDQFASACGVKNQLLFLDCRSLEWETIALPEDYAIIIADTMIQRKLTGGGYNQRHAECTESVRLLRENLPGINSLRDVKIADFNRFSDLLPVTLQKRARHVIEEIERTTQAKTYLNAGDIHGFGRLMTECHTSLRDLYEVSCVELDLMVSIAQSLDGMIGARLTGAGFGGCTVNLVESAKKEDFSAALKEKYSEVTGLVPEIYTTHAAKGADLIK